MGSVCDGSTCMCLVWELHILVYLFVRVADKCEILSQSLKHIFAFYETKLQNGANLYKGRKKVTRHRTLVDLKKIVTNCTNSREINDLEWPRSYRIDLCQALKWNKMGFVLCVEIILSGFAPLYVCWRVRTRRKGCQQEIEAVYLAFQNLQGERNWAICINAGGSERIRWSVALK